MFGKLKRLGTASCKVQITIELKWLTILDSKDYRPGLYIDFERGSKTVSSTSRELPVDPVDSKLVVYFDECLTLVMTLYKDTSGKFIEKKGKLVLKGVSTMSTTVVKLGSVNLSLHTLADHFEKKNMILQFGDSKGRTMGTINLATTAKYLGDTEANDEDSSVMSGVSRGTFSSLSHMDVLQSLGPGSTTPTVPYRREKASEFSENDTKLMSSMRSDSSRHMLNSMNKSASLSHIKSSSNAERHNALLTTLSPVREGSDWRVLHGDTEKRNIIPEFPEKYVDTDSDKQMTEIDINSDVSRNIVLDDKDVEIMSLRQQLKDAKSFQNAMEDEFQTKITSMIERIIEIEDENDLDHFNHEQQTIKLLKAAGIYEKSGYDLRDSENNLTYSDQWADLFRQQTDDERIKVMALKKCLIKFADQLDEEEKNDLLDAGIVLSVAKFKSYS